MIFRAGLALKIVGSLVNALIPSAPSSQSSRKPVTMMAAFEHPVTPTLDAAVAALNAHAQRVWTMVGKPSFVFALSSFINEKAATPAVARFAEGAADAAVPAAAG